MVSQRGEDGLPDPPHRITDELHALLRIKLPGGRDEADVALLDEIRERDTAVLIFLSNTDHEAQVRSREFLNRILIPQLSESAELLLTLRRDQFVAAHVAEVLIESALFLDTGVETGEKIALPPTLATLRRGCSGHRVLFSFDAHPATGKSWAVERASVLRKGVKS